GAWPLERGPLPCRAGGGSLAPAPPQPRRGRAGGRPDRRAVAVSGDRRARSGPLPRGAMGARSSSRRDEALNPLTRRSTTPRTRRTTPLARETPSPAPPPAVLLPARGSRAGTARPPPDPAALP